MSFDRKKKMRENFVNINNFEQLRRKPNLRCKLKIKKKKHYKIKFCVKRNERAYNAK